MFINYFILKELSAFLNKTLQGYIFSESFSQEKDKLIISFRGKYSGDIKYLEFSCSRELPFLILRKEFSKAKKNYAELFQECRDKEISGVILHSDDRLIRISFTDSSYLLFNFIPHKYNLFFVEGNEISNTFKSGDEFTGKNINVLLVKNQKKLKEGILSNKLYIKTLDSRLGEYYIKEILERSSLYEKEELTEKNRLNIRKYYNELIQELLNPVFIIYKTDNDFIMSLIKLRTLRNFEYQEFRNVNDMISEYFKQKIVINALSEIKSVLISDAEKKIKSLERKIENLDIQKKDAMNYDEFLNYGNIILLNIGKVKKGDDTFYYKDEDREVDYVIKLDKTLTPAHNAQKYFEKYKRQKKSVKLISDKILKSESELLILKEKLKKIKSKNDHSKLKALIKTESVKEDDPEKKYFRKFIINENFQVWVGKNAISNDLLTFKYTQQNDLWFHVRGFSGSHTVLKKSSKNIEIPKEIIKMAASIAAYYSKARNSGTIPVSYTERKFVKKSKGYKEGSVIMEREKVVFIKPALPEVNSR